ncbi:histidinolphosphatase [Actinomortierella ambigua]|nr:histidinolphosphatase [Actinomortierella ambigua]
MFSFHSHSGQFCMHATGTLEQVVQSAIAKKFTTYGLSEHMPRYLADQLYPEEAHLTTHDLEGMFDSYLTEAQRLREAYKDQITLLIGFETEYFGSQSVQWIRHLRHRHRLGQGPEGLPPVQYIVGSMHHVDSVPIDFSLELYQKALEVVGKGDWTRLFERYFETQYEMLQQLQPEVVGHFDLVRIFFKPAVLDASGSNASPSALQLTERLWSLVKRNIDYVVSYGGLFELNSRAWKKGLADAYPQRDILEYILEKGGRITLSDDSHGPKDVGMFYVPELKQYLERMNIKEVFYLAPKEEEHLVDASKVLPTNTQSETGSFQHVTVKSVPVGSLDFSLASENVSYQ